MTGCDSDEIAYTPGDEFYLTSLISVGVSWNAALHLLRLPKWNHNRKFGYRKIQACDSWENDIS
jgi:hypothetical protein